MDAKRVVCLLMLGLAGCTHHSLTRNTVLTTSTVMEIQYRSVLAHLALMSCHPETYPNHVNLGDGVVQINDRAGFGQAGGLTALGGSFGIERFGPSGQRQITEQWGTDATTDPERLYDLQSLYRLALGLPPMCPSNSLIYLRQHIIEVDDDDEDSDEGSSEGPSSPASSGGGGSVPSSGDSQQDSSGRRVPLEVMLSDVPQPGWYGLGRKKDVPNCACYVGQSGDRYAWVTADGMPQLAQFTATILLVLKLQPGERPAGKSGLAFTGN